MRKSRVKALADALVEALVRAGIELPALLQGATTSSGMLWYYPSLLCEDTLLGRPLKEYLQYPLILPAERFNEWYRETLQKLHHNPVSAYADNAWVGLAMLTRQSKAEDRVWRIAPPQAGDLFAGQRFAIDAAMLAYTSLPCSSFVQNDNNFYVIFKAGNSPAWVGVRDGLPVGGESWWDVPMPYVQAVAESPRGDMNEHCMFDMVDRVASALHETLGSGKIAQEFAGIENALRILRTLPNSLGHQYIVEAVQRQMTAQPETEAAQSRLLLALKDSLELLKSQASDRLKIYTAFEMLTTAGLPKTKFYKQIYDIRRGVPVVARWSAMEKAREGIEELIREQSKGD